MKRIVSLASAVVICALISGCLGSNTPSNFDQAMDEEAFVDTDVQKFVDENVQKIEEQKVVSIDL